jgi:CRISPR/Cas system-associated exonuclease Cas4 (RecB family)
MYRVTPSGIGMLLECPKCLWLYANEGVKRPQTIFPSLPSGMDEMFKKYFDKYRVKDELPPEIDGKVDGKLFGDLEKLEPWRNIDFGRGGFHAQFPDIEIELRGAIDELLINEKGEYVPFDFKTRGYPTKEDTHKHYQHQLDLYSLLFEKNDLKSAGYGYLLFFWPKEYWKGSTSFNSKLVKMNVSAESGMKILREVYEIISGEKPKSHEKCQFCMYRGDV